MNVRYYWELVMERKRVVLLAFIATLLSTLVGSLLWPATYEGTATIMLDYDSSNPMIMSMVSPQVLAANDYMNTQIEIIKSRRIADRVLDILRLDKSPEIIGTFSEATARRGLKFWGGGAHTDIKSWLTEHFLAGALKVVPAKEARFLYIRFYSADPNFSALVANAYAKAYTEYNLELKVTPFRDAENWFSAKLKDAKGLSDRASEQLREYQQQKGIITQQGAVFDDTVQRLDQINRELATAKAKLYESQVALKRVEQCRGDYGSLPEVLGNSFVQSLKGEKVKLETQLAELAGKAGASNPGLVRLRSTLETVNDRLQGEMQNIVSAIRRDNASAVQRVSTLEAAVGGLKRESTSANLSRYEMDSLSRESESYKQAYEAVLKKYSETSLQSDISRTNVFLVDAALPPRSRHSPNIGLNLAMAAVGGLFLGVGLVLLFNFLDDTVNSAEQLERLFGIPVLGNISSRKDM